MKKILATAMAAMIVITAAAEASAQTKKKRPAQQATVEGQVEPDPGQEFMKGLIIGAITGATIGAIQGQRPSLKRRNSGFKTPVMRNTKTRTTTTGTKSRKLCPDYTTPFPVPCGNP